jgi:hypothetical protein
MVIPTNGHDAEEFDGVVQAAPGTEYDGPGGLQALVFSDIDSRTTQHGNAVLFWFHKPGDPEQKVTGMASLNMNRRSKLVVWTSAISGRPVDQLMNTPTNLRDYFNTKVLAKIERKTADDGSEFPVVVGVQPLPEGYEEDVVGGSSDPSSSDGEEESDDEIPF